MYPQCVSSLLAAYVLGQPTSSDRGHGHEFHGGGAFFISTAGGASRVNCAVRGVLVSWSVIGNQLWKKFATSLRTANDASHGANERDRYHAAA